MFRLCVSLAVFCVLCCKFSVLSYPQGAPVRTESCINLQPIHMDPLTNQQVPNQQGTTRPYRILVSQQQYQTCTSNQQCGLQPLQGSLLNSVSVTAVIIHFFVSETGLYQRNGSVLHSVSVTAVLIHFILYRRHIYIKEKVVSFFMYQRSRSLLHSTLETVLYQRIFIMYQKKGNPLNSVSVKEVAHVVIFISHQKKFSVKGMVVNFILIRNGGSPLT